MTAPHLDHPIAHVRVEWIPAAGTPDPAHALLPMAAVAAHGVEGAFERATGHPRASILDYALDDLYDGNGVPFPAAPLF